MQPNREGIKKWLKNNGHDRFWLAEQCGVEKVSVDGWFSRNSFPGKAILIIQNLMESRAVQPHPISRPVINGMVALAVVMRPEEAQLIDEAAAALGMTSEEFIRKASVEDAEEFAKTKNAQKLSSDTPPPSQPSRQNDPTLIRGLDSAEETSA